jgi:hypothetical protein
LALHSAPKALLDVVMAVDERMPGQQGVRPGTNAAARHWTEAELEEDEERARRLAEFLEERELDRRLRKRPTQKSPG